METLAEIRLRSKGLVRPFVLGILAAVVIGDGLAQAFRNVCEPPDERLAHFTSRFRLELRELRVSRLALDAHLKRGLALPRDRRIRFPMSRDPSPLDRLGALGDGNSVGNMGFSVLPRMAAQLPLLVRSDQMRDQVALVGIDPLIDGFMTHREIGMKFAPAAGSDFRRPAIDDSSTDIASNARVFETVTLMADDISGHGSFVGFVRKIVPRMDWRCVPLEFARQGADISAELPSDGPKRLSFAPKHGNEVALLLGQVIIGFLGHNRAS